MPEDISSATMEAFVYLTFQKNPATGALGNQYWLIELYSAQPSAVPTHQTSYSAIAEWDGSMWTQTHWTWLAAGKFSFGTFPLTAGDMVLFKVSRLGGHANDTSDTYGFLHEVEFTYTADS